MPFIELEDLNCSVFYVINPLEPVTNGLPTDSTDIQCAPYDPAKPVLVMFHETCFQIASFNKQFSDERLKDAFNLVAISRIHHDRTKYWGDRDYLVTTNDQLGCVTAALDALEFPSFSLLGQGIGGCHMAIGVSIRRQARVTKLILSSPGTAGSALPASIIHSLYDSFKANKAGKGNNSGKMDRALLLKVIDSLQSEKSRTTASNYDDYLHDFISLMDLRYGLGTDSWELDQMRDAELQRQPFSNDLLARITIPVLILCGEFDFLNDDDLEAFVAWKSLLKNAGENGAQLHVIVSGFYSIISTCSNITNRFILQFARTSDGSGRKFSLPETPLLFNSGYITADEREQLRKDGSLLCDSLSSPVVPNEPVQ